MKTCFVVMGFGEKQDWPSGRKLNLESSYENIIKPAVEAAGYQCLRADEIAHVGIIDVPMYQHLLNADLVVADVSTMNPNAFYELGVRHALRPHTTIVMAECELKFPFDIGHTSILQYKHLGEDIGASEARTKVKELTERILAVDEAPADDSPVYTYLPGLKPPERAAPPPAPTRPGVSFSPGSTGDGSVDTVRARITQAEKARTEERWADAAALFRSLRDDMRKGTGFGSLDTYILQQLALATYKADGTETGLRAAIAILRELHPDTSRDPDTLGLWGSIHRRLWALTADRTSLDEALAAYENGFSVRNDPSVGINHAFLLDARASVAGGDDAIADRVLARRVRLQVIPACDAILAESERQPKVRYWTMAGKAEACFGTGDVEQFRTVLAEAIRIAPEPWMVKTTYDQLAQLAALLGGSAENAFHAAAGA